MLYEVITHQTAAAEPGQQFPKGNMAQPCHGCQQKAVFTMLKSLTVFFHSFLVSFHCSISIIISYNFV